LQSVYIAKALFATQTVKGLYPKPKGLGFTPSTHNCPTHPEANGIRDIEMAVTIDSTVG
jgi:hypothetical protein